MPDMFRYFKKYKGHSSMLKNMRRPYLPTQYEKSEKPARGANKFIYIVMAILSIGVLITFVNIYELRSFHDTYSMKHMYEPVVEGRGDKVSGGGGGGGGAVANDRPVVWVHGKKLETGYLKHVYTVFERLGYRFGDKSSSWDVLWCHDYPYIELASELSSLKPHQRINHFPGSGFITNKVNLATSTMPFIPKAFKLPGDKQRFLAYAKENPEMKWVQKSNNHRGIKVKSLAELDLEKQGSFVQQFIDNPYLIDGRKFDLAIYTVITSISPLRVYTMDGDLLIRFCPEEYYPFSPGIVGKYVIHDEYLPLWKMPSLKEIYGHGSNTFKQTLFSYLRSEV